MAGVQIFISYARDDDRPPPESAAGKGFVSFLHDQLLYQFNEYGPDPPRVWRDAKRVDAADQFGLKIQKAIEESSILLVVLSRHWLNSDYCRKELEAFATYWNARGGSAAERIVVVAKRHVDKDTRPLWLQGQVGYKFYTRDDRDDIGMEHEFFDRGKIADERYWVEFKKLAAHLWIRAGGETPHLTPVSPIVAGTGRTIYVAKPANDMRLAYDRVVKELSGRGYVVVPEPLTEIPLDASAGTFIDDNLAQAEASVHLLGTKTGPTPEDIDDPIVKLQLVRAAATSEAGPNIANGAAPRLRRLIWAPKQLENTVGSPEKHDERDPLEVLAGFDCQRSGDKIFSDGLSAFVISLTQNLDNTIPFGKDLGPVEADSRVYVLHRIEDRPYAINVAKVLQRQRMEPVLSSVKGTASQLNALHRRNLVDCDAVLLCWANAAEVWARASSRELKNWRQLGRSKQFAYRGLVLGPPPDDLKADFKDVLPKSEIDVVLDFTKLDIPSPEDLAPLISDAHHP